MTRAPAPGWPASPQSAARRPSTLRDQVFGATGVTSPRRPDRLGPPAAVNRLRRSIPACLHQRRPRGKADHHRSRDRPDQNPGRAGSPRGPGSPGRQPADRRHPDSSRRPFPPRHQRHNPRTGKEPRSRSRPLGRCHCPMHDVGQSLISIASRARSLSGWSEGRRRRHGIGPG